MSYWWPYESPVKTTRRGGGGKASASGNRPSNYSTRSGYDHLTAKQDDDRDDFLFMGNKVSGLDSSKFKKGTANYKLALERLNTKAESEESEALDNSSSSGTYFSCSEAIPQLRAVAPPPRSTRSSRTRPTTETYAIPAQASQISAARLNQSVQSVGQSNPIERNTQARNSRTRPTMLPELAVYATSAQGPKTPGQRVIRQVPASKAFIPILMTPPESTRKGTASSRLLKQESNDYLATPTKTPVRRTVVPTKHEAKPPIFGSNTSARSSYKQAAHCANTTWLPPTPDASPIKGTGLVAPKVQPARPPTVVSDSLFSSVPEKSITQHNGAFRPLTTKHFPILSLKPKRIMADGEPFQSYTLKNGDTLMCHQALDLQGIVDAAMTIEEMKLDGQTTWKDVPQGRILGYQMGTGKTHVAVSFMIEIPRQLELLYKTRGLKFKQRPMLVIAGKGLHPQWCDDIERLSAYGLKVNIYSKGKEPMKPGYDVYIATIDITRNQWKGYLSYWEAKEELYNRDPSRCEKPDRDRPTRDDLVHLAGHAPFFVTDFLCVIMDEFHNSISNPSTLNSRAALNLRSDAFLLLSGTPLQNHLNDLQVAITLLKHHSKRKSFREAEALMRKINRDLCGSRPKSMKPTDVVDFVNLANYSLIGQTMITRLNDPVEEGKQPLIEGLPDREDIVVMVSLSSQERVLYDYMDQKTEQVFVRILRRRQACLHSAVLVRPLLEMHNGKSEKRVLKELSNVAEDVTEEYPEVLREDDDEGDSGLPPDVSELEIDETLDDEYLSSKFRVVLGILKKIKKKGKGEKTLVFSNFIAIIRLLEKCLDDRGFGHVSYTGDMKSDRRQAALATIAQDKTCTVMLVSMKAGGTGLNITSCNNVIILDPWWNPAVEEQAVSRVHRKGQTCKVKVFRIIAPNTVEERIKEARDTTWPLS